MISLLLLGVPCRVVNYTSETIQCITGPTPPTSSVYPGMLTVTNYLID